MRMMMQVRIDTVAGNEAIQSGKIAEIVGQVMERLHPEASYFYPSGGQRAALFVFDMADASQIPPTVEPLFMGVNASIELTPVMNADDLQTGLGELQRQLQG